MKTKLLFKNMLATKKTCFKLVGIAMCLFAVMNINAQTYQYPSGSILFDFGDKDSTAAGWNNVYTGIDEGNDVTPISDATDCDGNSTGIGLIITGSSFRAVNTGGPTGLAESLCFPDKVSYDNFYGGLAATIYDTEFQFTGLDSDKKYDIVILAARTGATSRGVDFTVQGSESATYTVICGDCTPLEIASCTPASDGTITFTMDEGTTTDKWYHLNAIQIIPEGSDAINDVEVSQSMVYPNPATDYITVKVAEKSNVEIYDFTGKMVQQTIVEAGENGLSLSLNRGIYLVKVTGADNSATLTQLFVR